MGWAGSGGRGSVRSRRTSVGPVQGEGGWRTGVGPVQGDGVRRGLGRFRGKGVGLVQGDERRAGPGGRGSGRSRGTGDRGWVYPGVQGVSE